MIYDRFTCPDLPLSPPEEDEVDTIELPPNCPKCGKPAWRYYIDRRKKIIACENCKKEIKVWKYPRRNQAGGFEDAF